MAILTMINSSLCIHDISFYKELGLQWRALYLFKLLCIRLLPSAVKYSA